LVNKFLSVHQKNYHAVSFCWNSIYFLNADLCERFLGKLIALYAIVEGHVQGVYFRAFVVEKATRLGIVGFVRNLASRDAVEVWAEGDKTQLDSLLVDLRIGPPYSRVDKVTEDWEEYTGKYKDFVIKHG
jgi:acylphosphatase